MNKLSKLTALLLALVLALSVPLGALAERAEIETKTEYYEVADKILQKMIMAYETYGEYKSMAELIANEDFAAFYARLSAEDQEAMANYVIEKFWASCISYTEVGPFMPAIPVGTQEGVATFSLLARDGESDDGPSADNLHRDKKATRYDDGTYTVTLEAYVTGTVKVTETTTYNPADIVLVLDTSGSMEYDFAGNTTYYDSNKRWYALREALLGGNGTTGFIDQVAAKYDAANGVDHRIAIVDYDTSASRNIGLTYVNGDANIRDIKNAVPEENDYSGGTYPNTGLTEAQKILGTAYSYNGSSTKPRSKVVVLFTDGLPAYNGFSGTEAASAINTAKQLKDAGYTVYTVAIISDANPASTVKWSVQQNANRNNNTDAEVANAFLHAVSSNYKTATAEGTGSGQNGWGGGTPTGTLTVTPGTGGNNGYYLTAANKDDLNKIFEGIAGSIESGSSTSTLTETTVVQDVMSPYFELPDGYSSANITITEYNHTGDDANGNPTWTKANGTTATATIVDKKTVQVTGFNFQENAVVTLTNNNQKEYKGKKLEISFNIEPVDGFLGGNGVITNDKATSGIYDPDGKLVSNFPEPSVNVPVEYIQLDSNDQHIYLSNTADLTELIEQINIFYYIVDGAGGANPKGPYTVDKIRNGYTDIVFTVYNETDGQEVGTFTIQDGTDEGTWQFAANQTATPVLTKDTQYSFTCTVTATTGATHTTQKVYSNIYVYTPEVTFQDTEHDYLAPVTAEKYYDTNNLVGNSLKWYNQTLQQYSTAAKVIDAETNQEVSAMLGNEPTLIFTYSPASTEWIEDGKVAETTCRPVNVTNVLIDGDYDININATTNADKQYLKTTRVVKTCTACGNQHGTATATDVTNNNLVEFVVHIKNAFSELKIVKKGLSVGESAIFTVTGYVPDGTADGEQKNWTVVLTKTSADDPFVTITGLLVNSQATVAEDGNWSWRYKTTTYAPTSASVKIIPKTTAGYPATVTVSNSDRTEQWLDDEVAVKNDFSVNGSGTVID